MRQTLADLYGCTAAQAVRPRLETLISTYRPPGDLVENPRDSLGLNERDILLISYPDQVRSDQVNPLASLGEFLDRRLQGLVTGLHLLPFFPASSDDGFAVSDFMAVDPQHGTWEQVRHLGERFRLMFDLVLNHVSSRHPWFQGFQQGDPRYRDFFITVTGEPDLSAVVRPRTLPLLTPCATPAGEVRVWTTFSADQIDLNYRNPEVLLRMIETLLYYVSQGARLIRLDAVAYVWKEIGTSCIHRPQAHALVRLLRAVLDAAAPRVLLITETNVPHADNVSYFGDGWHEAQLVYNFALPPLVLHALQTGRANSLTQWLRALEFPGSGATFLNFLASHDGVGVNPGRGLLPESAIAELARETLRRGGLVSEKTNPDGSRSPYELNINYLDALTEPGGAVAAGFAGMERFLTAHGILLALAGLPALYFHSLFGSRGDRAGADRTGLPRRINRQKLDRATLERELDDPASTRAWVFSRLRALLAARRAAAAFHPHSRQEVLELDERVLAFLRLPENGARPVLCLFNASDASVEVEIPSRGAASGGAWWDLVARRSLSVGEGRVPRFWLAPRALLWATPVRGDLDGEG